MTTERADVADHARGAAAYAARAAGDEPTGDVPGRRREVSLPPLETGRFGSARRTRAASALRIGKHG